MRTLMLRSVSERWGEHTEPRVAIVRLDTDPRRPRTDPAALRRRLGGFAMVVEGMIMSGVHRVAALRGDDVVNRLVTVDYSGTGGGLDDQWYQEGCFALDDDEVLLIETRLDPACRTFSLSLTDALFSTIDWANAHSSLNRHQAVVDADGVLRVVVSTTDPGVRNWLDTTGHRVGVMQFRWSGTASAPELSVRKVAGGSLADELPKSVARVTPRAARRRDPRPPGRRATALPLVAHRPYASGHTWFPEWGFRGKLKESTTGPAPFEQGGGSEAGDRPSPGRKVAEMGGERAAYDATSAVDGHALWRRVVSVAEGRARVRSRRAPFRDRARSPRPRSSPRVHRAGP